MVSTLVHTVLFVLGWILCGFGGIYCWSVYHEGIDQGCIKETLWSGPIGLIVGVASLIHDDLGGLCEFLMCIIWLPFQNLLLNLVRRVSAHTALQNAAEPLSSAAYNFAKRLGLKIYKGGTQID